MCAGDCLAVCEAINGNTSDFHPIEPVVVAMIALIRDRSWRLSHVRRSANLMAHKVAAWAASEDFCGNIPISCIPFEIISCDLYSLSL